MTFDRLRAGNFVAIVGLLTTWALAMVQHASSQATPIPWRADFAEAQKEAQANGKPLFVVFR